MDKMSVYLKTPDNNVFVLYKKSISIGTDNCDLNLASPVADAKHATLQYSDTDGSLILTDLNSRHGTFVNGCLVRNSSVRVIHGDIIKFDVVGQEYQVCCGEVPKVVTRTLSLDQNSIKHSRTFPPIVSSPSFPTYSGEGTLIKGRPSSGRNKRSPPSTTRVPPIGEKPSSALRRALSQGSLSSAREQFRENFHLHRSRSGDESILQLPFSEPPEKPLESASDPQPIRHETYNFPFSPREVAFDFRYLHHVPQLPPTTSAHSSPRSKSPPRHTTSIGDFGAASIGGTSNYRFNFEETMDKHNELRQLTEQMHDLKTVDQDTSAAKLQTFLELREKEARMVRDELTRFQRDKKVLSDILSQMAKDLINKDATIKVQDRNLQEKDSVIKTYVRGLQSKEEFILEQVRTIQQKDEVMKEQTKRLNEREEAIRRFERIVRDRDETNQRQAVELAARETVISEQKVSLSRKEETMGEQKETIETKDKKLKKSQEDLRHKEDVIKAQTKCLLDKEDRITELSKNWDEAEKNIVELEKNKRERDDQINRLMVERDRLAGKMEGTRGHLVHMFKLYLETSNDTALEMSNIKNLENVDIDSILLVMEETLQKEIDASKHLQIEAERLSSALTEEHDAKVNLERELTEALGSLEDLRKTTESTISSLEEMNTKIKEAFEALDVEKRDVDEELATAKDKCRQLEATEKELRQKVTDTEFELESFRRQVIQTTFAIPGMVPPTGPISTRSVVAAIEQLATERNEMSRKIAELKGAIRQQKLTNQEESLARKVLKEMLDKTEEMIKTKGRWKSSLNEAMTIIEETASIEAHEWVKSAILEVYRRESRWQVSIEDTLERSDIKIEPGCIDCGELILQHNQSVKEVLRTKETSIVELQEKFTALEAQSAKEKEQLEERLTRDAAEQLKTTLKTKETEMELAQKELQLKMETAAEEKLRETVEEIRQKAEEDKETLISEKEIELGKLKETTEQYMADLQQKDEMIQEITEKLDLAQQEVEGKLAVARSPSGLSEISVAEDNEITVMVQPEIETDDLVEVRSESKMFTEMSEVGKLRDEIERLNGKLQSKVEEVDQMREQMNDLQEKSDQLLAERGRRPSSVPGSRKGRYAMNLERLVQNLSIENASYKLQLEQRDSIISELRNQIGALKQRHLPANLAELQQKEMNEVLEQLQERDGHIDNLRDNLKRLMEDISKRDLLISQQEEEMRQFHDQYHTSQTKMEMDDFRRLNSDLSAMTVDEKDLSAVLMNGYESSPGQRLALMPTMHEVFRCRYCKHDRSKLLGVTKSARQPDINQSGPQLNVLHSRQLHPSELSPTFSRRNVGRRSVSTVRNRNNKFREK